MAGLRFHRLKGNPPRWSVRISANYRITFGWTGETAHEIDFEDYHQLKERMEKKNKLPPIHPGEVLKEDILSALGMSVTAAAKALGVSRQMLHDILAGRKPLSAVMCLRLARLFGSTPEFWMRLQTDYDLKIAVANKQVMARVARIVPIKATEKLSA